MCEKVQSNEKKIYDTWFQKMLAEIDSETREQEAGFLRSQEKLQMKSEWAGISKTLSCISLGKPKGNKERRALNGKKWRKQASSNVISFTLSSFSPLSSQHSRELKSNEAAPLVSSQHLPPPLHVFLLLSSATQGFK